jgi:outer membrane protein OmpA-like peptidoglycan-associated protein
MKELLYAFIIILFHQISFSQNDKINISGKITSINSNEKSEVVKNALVHLKLSDGGMFEVKSNDTGYYFFIIKPFKGIAQLSVASEKLTTFVNSKSNGFLSSKETYTFDCSELQNFIADFNLSSSPSCILTSPPLIYFKQNSKKVYWGKDNLSNEIMNPEKTINFYYELMISNPEIIVEIRGHSDYKEKHQQKLSLKRAKYVAKSLVKKGIDKERINIVGEGIFQRLIKDEDIKTNKTSEEIEALRQKNRRITFRIVRWDYTKTK